MNKWIGTFPEFIKSVFQKSLYDLAKLALAPLLSAVFVNVILKMNFRDFYAQFGLHITITVFAVLFYFVSFHFDKREASKSTDTSDCDCKKISPANNTVDCHEYVFVSKKIQYNYESMNTLSYSRKYHIRAERDGIKMFEDKYHWTGVGNVNVFVKDVHQELFVTRKDDVYQNFVVYFAESLRKGDEVFVEVFWDIEITGEPPIPFMASSVHVMTAELEMMVRFNTEFFKLNNEVHCCETELVSNKTLSKHNLSLAQHGNYLTCSWNRSSPILGSRLKMSWQFA